METEQFRLPSGTRVGYVRLRVSHLERSLAFYEELLGFHQLKNEGVVLSAKESGPALIFLTEERNARPRPPRTTGLYHIAVRLPNRVALARLLRRLLDNQAQLRGFADHRVSEAVYLSDPDGNGVELYVDRPRVEWPWQQNQIQMTTDPLDVHDLLAAAQDDPSPWRGIHPEADIGHIHLQVSNLDRSDRFYSGVLGFDVTQRSYPGAIFLSAGGYHHHIGLNTWTSSGAQPPASDAVGLISFAVLIPEKEALQKVTSRLAAAGIPFEWGNQGSLIVRDDDQIAVELMIADDMGTIKS